MYKNLKKKENTSVPEENISCNICFEQVKKEDKKEILKCNHEYHLECIEIWKNTVKKESNIYIDGYKCPYCRM
jgi:hypothetical protein